MSWRVLKFQPYFTSTASNCGYTWWSHDIGGHCFGRHDDEMYVRWVQLGTFSPIMRLHSSNDPLSGKEPWNYGWEAEMTAERYLRLRHELIPYLYSMNYRTHKFGRALCEPLYYDNPECEGAYKCRNGYMFGSELLVCPVTSKINKRRAAPKPVYGCRRDVGLTSSRAKYIVVQRRSEYTASLIRCLFLHAREQ